MMSLGPSIIVVVVSLQLLLLSQGGVEAFVGTRPVSVVVHPQLGLGPSRRYGSRPPLTPHTASISNTASTEVERIQSGTVPIETVDAIVCGGGPAGLLTAIMLAKQQQNDTNQPRFGTIHLYDRLSPPPHPDDEAAWSDIAKFYLIGLGGRGQTALGTFDLWESEVLPRCITVLGRKDWTPESKEPVERIFGDERKVQTQILPRDKLVGVLHEYIVQNFSDRIQLNFNYEVQPVSFEYPNKDNNSDDSTTTQTLIRVAKCSDETLAGINPSTVKTRSENPEMEDTVLCDTDSVKYKSTPLLVAADGTIRTISNAMEELDRQEHGLLRNPFAEAPFRVKRYVDDNQRVYKTVPFRLPEDWRHDLNYSARTEGARINFDALPANKKGDYCGVLLLKKEDPMARAHTNPQALRKLFDENLPQFSPLIDDDTVAQVAAKPVSYLPGFRYAGPRLYQGQSCVLLGDCIHTVKPYFGLGANSALEDVEELEICLQQHPDVIPQAIRAFSNVRAPEAKTLVRVSRELDRPGPLGALVFVAPLVMDAIFSKLAPSLFQPNIITMLQRDGYTFQEMARRKRIDRFVQLTIIASVLAGMGVAATVAIKWLISTGIPLIGALVSS